MFFFFFCSSILDARTFVRNHIYCRDEFFFTFYYDYYTIYVYIYIYVSIWIDIVGSRGLRQIIKGVPPNMIYDNGTVRGRENTKGERKNK